MSKYDPPEKDLGFNPYVCDQDTHYKLNQSHYSPDNVDHRKRINKWKERENDRAKMAERLGVKYTPALTPASDILQQIENPKQ